MKNLILDLLKNNITVTLKLVGEDVHYYIEGFYKEDGFIFLTEAKEEWNKDFFRLYGRHKEICLITDLKDLVAVNFNMWQTYKERYEGWENPDKKWLPLLEQYGYVQVELVPKVKILK